MELGYVPSTATGSVSITTEYARDDFALASLARAVGHLDDAALLETRSHSWRALYDPSDGLLWAKKTSGEWDAAHLDPSTPSSDFIEANAWQSVWMPSHDLDGLTDLAGGREALVDQMTDMFMRSKSEWQAHVKDKAQLRDATPRPYYWAGNEPDIHAPYLFVELGRPDLTQEWVRWILDTQYGTGADGLPGNDDGGTMSAWYIFSTLGIYPLVGTDRYVIGTPLFTHAEITVAGGTFVIDAKDASGTNLYVQSATLDGAPLTTPFLTHADITATHTLELVMGPRPSSWGQ
jgi:predicted alpha-1,2-mannosidase